MDIVRQAGEAFPLLQRGLQVGGQDEEDPSDAEARRALRVDIQDLRLGGQRVLDTHLGSGSSRIAAYMMGLDFWGCEIDTGYYRSQEERFRRECLGVERVGEREVIQGSLFQ